MCQSDHHVGLPRFRMIGKCDDLAQETSLVVVEDRSRKEGIWIIGTGHGGERRLIEETKEREEMVAAVAAVVGVGVGEREEEQGKMAKATGVGPTTNVPEG